MTNSFQVIPTSPICISAIAARTPLGRCAQSSAAAVRVGLSALQDHPFYTDRFGEPIKAAVDPFLPHPSDLNERLIVMLGSVLSQMSIADRLDLPSLKLVVIINLSTNGGDLTSAQSTRLSDYVAAHFPTCEAHIRFLAAGHAGGLLAMGMALREIETGAADLAIVAGAECYFSRSTLEALDASRWLKSDDNRDGFFPAEGAGACLIARVGLLRQFKMKVLSQITAVTTANEEITIDANEGVCVGEGLSAAMLAIEPIIEQHQRRITDTWCDLNGMRYRNEELTYSILRVAHLWENTAEKQHPADCWGDMGAASALLFVALACEANARDYALGQRTALWGGSHDGRRALALLDFPMKDKT